MKRPALATWILISAALAVPALQAQPAQDRHVIFISIDGLAHYYFDDPKADMPTLRKLAAQGARARRMTASLPTVTWPNHTTLVTGVQPGRHGVIGNSYFDRDKQADVAFIPDPVFDKDEIVRVPTIYDVAHQGGLKTAAIIWPASRNAKTLDWTVPDVGTQELFEKYGTASLLAECRAQGIPVDKQEAWVKNGLLGYVHRDRLYTQMTKHLIKTHKPNLLLLHLVALDSFQHATGRQTPEAYNAIKMADNHVRDIVQAVEEEGLLDKTTFVIVSDHGFVTYEKLIQPNVLFKQAGLIKALGSKPLERRIWSFSQGVAYIYVLDEANREALLNDVKPKLAALEGVLEVIEEKDFAKYGLLTAAQDRRMPDLIVSATEGYYFSNNVGGEDIITATETPKGAHGYSPAHPLMDATFIASGAGIKPGVVLDRVDNVDMSPTVARLLGLEMKNVDGKVLETLLK